MRASRLLLLLVLGTVTPGCFTLAVAAAGAGAAALYTTGELRATEPAAPDEMLRAARETLEDLDIPVLSANSTEIDAKLVARTADDRRITIRVARRAERRSDLYIRVGVLGDEALSHLIHSGIRERL